MGLETVNDDGTARLHQLNTANPTGTDNKNQGDDHIRNIKKAIKDQFSGISEDTDSGAVTATADELNKLDGCTATTANLNALTGITDLYDVIYPVGCIYESTESDNPNDLFPGTTWSSFGQGKMLVGLDPNDDDFDSTSDSGGSKTVTLTEDQMPSHDHDDTFATLGSGGHSHSVSGTAANGGSHTHGTNLRFKTNDAILGGQKTVTGGTTSIDDDYHGDGHAAFTSTIGNNVTTHTGHTHSVSGTAANVSNHTHTITGSVSNAGGGQAHDNMPPYVVVYRWKRDS